MNRIAYRRSAGRWFLLGAPLHCGDILSVSLEDGAWIPCRFELAFGAAGARPVVHLPFLGADPSIDACALTFRWPAVLVDR